MFQVGSSTWLVPRWKHWVTRWHSSIRFWRSRCIQILHSLKRNHVIGMRSPARMLDMSCNAKMPDTSWYRIRIHLGKLHLSPLHGIFYISPSLPPSLRPSLPPALCTLSMWHACIPIRHLPIYPPTLSLRITPAAGVFITTKQMKCSRGLFFSPSNLKPNTWIFSSLASSKQNHHTKM